MELHMLIFCNVKALDGHFQYTGEASFEDLMIFKWGKSH